MRLHIWTLQKKKDLQPLDGHVLLLEYWEEHPALVARPGPPPGPLTTAAHARA